MKRSTFIIAVAVGIILLAAIGYFWWPGAQTTSPTAGNATNTPPVATTTQPDNTQGNQNSPSTGGKVEDMIGVSEPQPNAEISSPLTVRGRARGPWYFEASFPVTLLDSQGNIIAQVPAQAQGEWMTEAFVPFEVTLQFPATTTGSGTLVLQKDNPSGLPEYDAELRIPVRFKSTPKGATVSAGCMVGGCSSQLCTDAGSDPVSSTCEWSPIYACYQTAICEKQPDGKCGWTPTTDLLECLNNGGVQQ